jgi:hypothetical protein
VTVSLRRSITDKLSAVSYQLSALRRKGYSRGNPAEHQNEGRAAVQAVESEPPRIVRFGFIEGADLHPHVAEPRTHDHREIHVRRNRDEDRGARDEGPSRKSARRLELDENREDHKQREHVLDGFEAAQQLSEDPPGQIPRRDLPEEDRRRQHDDERAAHPEREREADDLAGGFEQSGAGVYRYPLPP